MTFTSWKSDMTKPWNKLDTEKRLCLIKFNEKPQKKKALNYTKWERSAHLKKLSEGFSPGEWLLCAPEPLVLNAANGAVTSTATNPSGWGAGPRIGSAHRVPLSSGACAGGVRAHARPDALQFSVPSVAMKCFN